MATRSKRVIVDQSSRQILIEKSIRYAPQREGHAEGWRYDAFFSCRSSWLHSGASGLSKTVDHFTGIRAGGLSFFGISKLRKGKKLKFR
jgi:hypothetical protein